MVMGKPQSEPDVTYFTAFKRPCSLALTEEQQSAPVVILLGHRLPSTDCFLALAYSKWEIHSAPKVSTHSL